MQKNSPKIYFYFFNKTKKLLEGFLFNINSEKNFRPHTFYSKMMFSTKIIIAALAVINASSLSSKHPKCTGNEKFAPMDPDCVLVGVECVTSLKASGAYELALEACGGRFIRADEENSECKVFTPPVMINTFQEREVAFNEAPELPLIVAPSVAAKAVLYYRELFFYISKYLTFRESAAIYSIAKRYSDYLPMIRSQLPLITMHKENIVVFQDLSELINVLQMQRVIMRMPIFPFELRIRNDQEIDFDSFEHEVMLNFMTNMRKLVISVRSESLIAIIKSLVKREVFLPLLSVELLDKSLYDEDELFLLYTLLGKHFDPISNVEKTFKILNLQNYPQEMDFQHLIFEFSRRSRIDIDVKEIEDIVRHCEDNGISITLRIDALVDLRRGDLDWMVDYAGVFRLIPFTRLDLNFIEQGRYNCLENVVRLIHESPFLTEISGSVCSIVRSLHETQSNINTIFFDNFRDIFKFPFNEFPLVVNLKIRIVLSMFGKKCSLQQIFNRLIQFKHLRIVDASREFTVDQVRALEGSLEDKEWFNKVFIL